MSYLRTEWHKLRRSSLARNAGWVAVGQGASFLLQAVYFVLLARLLGSSQYGIYAGAFALASLASQYSAVGSGTVFLRYVSVEPGKFAAYWGNILLLLLSVGTAVTLLLHVTAHYALNAASAAIVLPASLGVCVCAQIAFSAGQVFQAFEQLRITALMNLLTNFMRTLAAASMVLVLHHATAWQWAWVSLVVSFLAAVIAVVTVTVRLGRPKFQARLLTQHAAEGLQYSFAQSTSSAYNDLDKTMLSHYGMNVANGIYSMAYRVVDVATIPIFSIRDAAMPRFFGQGADGIERSGALGYSLLKRAVWLGVAAAVCMFVLAPTIPYIVGHDFAQGVSALRWLCLIPLFRGIHQMTGSALTGAGMQRFRTASQCIAAGGNFALNLWLIPTHGWLGAAWASLVTDGGLGVMNWVILTTLCRSATRMSITEQA